MSTKTSQVIENLGLRLRRGEWAQETSLPPIASLSGEYKVSSGTVALALRSLEREGLVKVVPRQGVFSAVEQGDTSGPAIGSPRVGIYGRYSTKKGKGYMPTLTNSILESAHGLGGSVLMLPKVSPHEILNRRYLEKERLQGIVVIGGDYLADANRLREQGFPVITPAKPIVTTAMNYVSFDHVHSVRSMTRHFAAAGHQRIAVLTYETSTLGLYESFKKDFIHALCQADILYNPNDYWRLVDWPPDELLGLREKEEKEKRFFATIDELLALPIPPTAFFCRDFLLQPLLKYFEYKRLRVPEDISVICSAYADEDSALTSGYILQFEQLGKRLVEGLYEIIRNPFHSVQEMIPLPFLDKGTVGSPPLNK